MVTGNDRKEKESSISSYQNVLSYHQYITSSLSLSSECYIIQREDKIFFMSLMFNWEHNENSYMLYSIEESEKTSYERNGRKKKFKR